MAKLTHYSHTQFNKLISSIESRPDTVRLICLSMERQQLLLVTKKVKYYHISGLVTDRGWRQIDKQKARELCIKYSVL